MRIGATLLYHAGMAYQSYGWQLLRPLGNLQNAISFLEEYSIDEISIIRPIRGKESFHDFTSDFQKIKNLRSMTPISFGGGIRSKRCLDLLTDVPFERFIFTSAFLDKNAEVIKSVSNIYGKQSIVCLLPIEKYNSESRIFHPTSQEYLSLTPELSNFIGKHANEVVVYDIHGEGTSNAFDWDLLDEIPIRREKIILSGGIGPGTYRRALEQGLAAVSVENRILHDEYSVIGKYSG